MTPEGKVLADCLKYLNALPETMAHKVHGGRYGRAGEPDIDGCMSGRSLKIEVKAPGKKPTALQLKRLRDWEAVGAIAGWVDSLEALEELIADALR